MHDYYQYCHLECTLGIDSNYIFSFSRHLLRLLTFVEVTSILSSDNITFVHDTENRNNPLHTYIQLAMIAWSIFKVCEMIGETTTTM